MAAIMRAQKSGALPGEITGLSIDTRSIGKGEAFFAIAGEQFAKHAVKLRRPGDADSRSEVILVGREESPRVAYVAADALIDTVRVKRGLRQRLALSHLRFQVNFVRIFKRSV